MFNMIKVWCLWRPFHSPNSVCLKVKVLDIRSVRPGITIHQNKLCTDGPSKWSLNLILVSAPFLMMYSFVLPRIEISPDTITESRPKRSCWVTQQSLLKLILLSEHSTLSIINIHREFIFVLKEYVFNDGFASVHDLFQTPVSLLCGLQSN